MSADQRTEQAGPLYHFECPECEYDDEELGRPVPWGDHYCPMCAEDNGRDVMLRLTRIWEHEDAC